MKKDSLQEFCSKIIHGLEKKVTPWVKRIPRNAFTDKFYTGINALMLNCVSLERGYCYPNVWATPAQWMKCGFMVSKRPDNFQGDYRVLVLKVEQRMKAVDQGDIIKLSKYNRLETYAVFHLKQVNTNMDTYEYFLDSKQFNSNLKTVPTKEHLRNISTEPELSNLALTIASGFLNAEMATGHIEHIAEEDLQKAKQDHRFLIDSASDAFKLIKSVYKQENDLSCFTDEND